MDRDSTVASKPIEHAVKASQGLPREIGDGKCCEPLEPLGEPKPKSTRVSSPRFFAARLITNSTRAYPERPEQPTPLGDEDLE
jgi:hypothetical protein